VIFTSEVHESVINVILADILSRGFGIDCRAERVSGRKRPDIRCFYRGLKVCIEASYNQSDAEKDARGRLEQGLADVAIALWIKKRFKDVSEQLLREEIIKSKYDVKILLLEELEGLLKYIEDVEKKGRVAGWFTEVDIPSLARVLDNAISYLASEEEVLEEINNVKRTINDFINESREVRQAQNLLQTIGSILYKAYGFDVAQSKDIDVIMGQAALSILLSTIFHEHVRPRYSVATYVSNYGPIQGLRKALEDLLQIDYEPAIKLTVEILDVLPPALAPRVKEVIDLGLRIAQKPALLARDFAGRIYHEITGDIAVRKGFATFYTEVPAAYLLANLALRTLFGLEFKRLSSVDRDYAKTVLDLIKSIKIADFACGSGTLLTAIYYNLLRVFANTLCFYHALECPEDLGKKIVEEGIYGLDALRYAVQITAINLALIGSPNFVKENIHTIYLGYIPSGNAKGAWLGSLELLHNAKRVGGLLPWIEKGFEDVVKKISVKSEEGHVEIPEKLDIIVMNPPFTRATGRVGEEFAERERGLFGFIPDKSIREEVKKKYDSYRDEIRKDMMKIANQFFYNNPNIPKDLQEILHRVLSGDKELGQLMSIGQAGEGLLFLYLAYKYVKSGGVIAFVLPRNVLSGISWFLARALLASKFHLKYVIVSSDNENGYNFSEGTSLSEALLVAKRVEEHEPNEETIFINFIRKPRTALEALMFAEKLAERSNGNIVEIKTVRKEGSKTVESVVSAVVRPVKRDELVGSIDNWNRFVATPELELVDYVLSILEKGSIKIGTHTITIPMIRLNEVITSIGIDRHQFNDNFNCVGVSTPYPIVYGGGEDVRCRMLVKPNAFASPKTSKANNVFERYASRVLVPDRIWWDTTHVIALYSKEPLLSNIFYAVKVNTPGEVKELAEKVLVLWLNTTWGILCVLFNREETRGRWTSLKMAHWRLLPILDVTKVPKEVLEKLKQVFDKYSNKTLRRIPEQFNPNDPDPVRLELDVEFLKVFKPDIDGKFVREQLLQLYRQVHTALQLWIK